MALKAGGGCRRIAYHRVQSRHPCYSIHIPTINPFQQMSADSSMAMRMTDVWPLKPPPLKKLRPDYQPLWSQWDSTMTDGP